MWEGPDHMRLYAEDPDVVDKFCSAALSRSTLPQAPPPEAPMGVVAEDIEPIELRYLDPTAVQ